MLDLDENGTCIARDPSIEVRLAQRADFSIVLAYAYIMRILHSTHLLESFCVS